MICTEPVSMITLLPKIDQAQAIEINNILEDEINIINKNIKIVIQVCQYVSSICETLCKRNEFDNESWTNAIACYLNSFMSDDDANKVCDNVFKKCKKKWEIIPIDDSHPDDLCNVEFSLAYGGMILLNSAKLHVRRGHIYGLLGHNGCGKSTLMRAIANKQLDEFPMDIKTCFVDHDIDGSDATETVLEWINADKGLMHLTAEEKKKQLDELEFTEEMQNWGIGSLSGGWKMKLALARAVLTGADMLLLDEPTNHLDVKKVAWLKSYLTSLKQCTSIVISHDSKFLQDVVTDVIHYERRKLIRYPGQLTNFMNKCPDAKAYFSFAESVQVFHFPQPGPLEGIKSKTKAILKLTGASFKYPSRDKFTLVNASAQCSMASRIAVIGPNGAGKSTLIKMLVGELRATEAWGNDTPEKNIENCYWRHPNCRIAYVAQHAFHHIEQHLSSSPVQYIQWRFSSGLDKEAQELEQLTMTDKEKKCLEAKLLVFLKEQKGAEEIDEAGNIKPGTTEFVFDYMETWDAKTNPVKADMHGPQPRMIKQLLGRRQKHGDYEYEVKWVELDVIHNVWMPKEVLEKFGFGSMVRYMDDKIAAESGNVRPLTTSEIQKHLDLLGLPEDFGTYGKLAGLSGGQKVKVVLAAATWFCPHLLILDEPTNYLDRDSLGALTAAIKDFEGGVLMISHNEEFFGPICPERWEIPGDTTVTVTGAEWMEAVKAKELEAKKSASKLHLNQEKKFDSFGNEIVRGNDGPKIYTAKELKEMEKKMKDMKKKNANPDDMLDLEIEIDEARKQVDKIKSLEKAEKEKEKIAKKTSTPFKDKKGKK